MKKEALLQIAVANYIATNYPDVNFHSDFGSGVKLTPMQAKLQASQNAHRAGWPDMFIAKPRLVLSEDGEPDFIHGLFIELKADGTTVYRRDGKLTANKHIRDQAKVLESLRLAGYRAEFAVGFYQAKKLIDDYLESEEEMADG